MTTHTPALDANQLLLIERACESLSIAYARAVDFRDYEALVGLFVSDGSLIVGRELKGQDAIRASLMSRPDALRSRHVLTNSFIDVLNAHEARGIAYLTLYRHQGDASLGAGPVDFAGPAAVGHYEDRFVETPEGWRFRSRRLHLAFRNPELF